MKNIVVCCDGTMAQYGHRDENSNIVRLFERLAPDGQDQVSYYDPGVGTYSPDRNPIGRAWAKLKMGVAGRGVRTNVNEAYRYLMQAYEPGDHILPLWVQPGSVHCQAVGRNAEQVRAPDPRQRQPHTVRSSALPKRKRRYSCRVQEQLSRANANLTS